MINDIFKRVDDLPRETVPDAWVLSPTQSLTMGDVRELVARVRSLMITLENKKRDELIQVAAQLFASRTIWESAVVSNSIRYAEQLIDACEGESDLEKEDEPKTL